MYLTDDRSAYRQGYYYVDWLHAIEQHHTVDVWGPGYADPDRSVLDQAELVIIGHGAWDVIQASGYHRRWRRWWPGARRRTNPWPFRIGQLTCPKVLLSKNDYKEVEAKAVFAHNEGVGLVVTHSQSAVATFRAKGVTTAWVPFGVDLGRFADHGHSRQIDIGFRGKANDQWNAGCRRRLVEATMAQCGDLSLDVVLSEDADGFLFADRYVAWLNRCRFMLNTVSAIGTVGPRWWETMATGCVSIAPEATYEGLLTPNVHYLAVRDDFADIRVAIDRYERDGALRSQIQEGTAKKVAEASMQRRYEQLWSELHDHGMVSADN